MSDYSYPPIHFPLPSDPGCSVDDFLKKTDEFIRLNRHDDARTYLSQVQRVVNTADTQRIAEINRLWDKLSYPFPAQQDYYEEQGGATNGDNRPGDTLDKLEEESDIPKKKVSYQKFTLKDDFKEKMLKFIFLTHKDHWYKLRDNNREPSFTDVCYWYGVLLDYNFGNKTTKLYEPQSEDDMKALAQEFQSFAHELHEMAKTHFKAKKS